MMQTQSVPKRCACQHIPHTQNCYSNVWKRMAFSTYTCKENAMTENDILSDFLALHYSAISTTHMYNVLQFIYGFINILHKGDGNASQTRTRNVWFWHWTLPSSTYIPELYSAHTTCHPWILLIFQNLWPLPHTSKVSIHANLHDLS